MARAALGIEQRELARLVGASKNAILRFEMGETIAPRCLAAICDILEERGVTFTFDERGDPLGVECRK